MRRLLLVAAAGVIAAGCGHGTHERFGALRVTGVATARLVTAPPPASRGPAQRLGTVAFVDARVGFAAAPGRIQRTGDGGATWRDVWRGRGWSVGWLAVRGRTTWAAARAPGGRAMLLRSRDAGAHWRATRATLPAAARLSAVGDRWEQLEVHLLDERSAWAVIDPASWAGPLFLRTRDGGATWALVRGLEHATDAQFVDVRVGFAVAPTARCNGIWRTGDGGATWRRLFCAPLPLFAVQFFDRLHGLAAGGRPSVTEEAPSRVVYGTTDGGRTWRLRYSNGRRGYAGGGDPIARIRFADAANAWARSGECKCCPNGACAGEVLVTRDGGRSWRRRFVADEFATVDAHRAWAVQECDAGCGTLWRTEDAGATWRPLARPESLSFETVAAVGRTLAVDTAEGASIASGDGGRSWRVGPPAAPSELGTATFAAARGLTVTAGGPFRDFRTRVVVRSGAGTHAYGVTDGVLLVGAAGPRGAFFTSGSTYDDRCGDAPLTAAHVAVTRDGGVTWYELHAPFRVASLALSGRTVAATGLQPCRRVFGISRDGGRAWTVRRTAHDCLPSLAGDRAIWLACARSVLRSSDRGKTWTRMRFADTVPTAIAAVSADEAWATFPRPRARAGRLWHTTDGGRTWRETWPRVPMP